MVPGATVDPPRTAGARRRWRRRIRARWRAALFDFLFGQCDRHAQNVLTVEGDRAIDNDQALGRGESGGELVPHPGEREVHRRASATSRQRDAPPIKDANPQVVLIPVPRRRARRDRPRVSEGARGGTAWLDENADDEQQRRRWFLRRDAEHVRARARSLRRRGLKTRGGARNTMREKWTEEKTKTHRVFAWPEPCCALTEMRERDTLVGHVRDADELPGGDGGVRCKGARDAAR